MVYRFQLNYNEIIIKLILKIISTKRTRYSLIPGNYEMVDLNNALKYILPNNVKVNVTKDGVRAKSIKKLTHSPNFTEKSFFYTILDLTRYHSYPSDDIEGFYQLIAGSYKSAKPINLTGTDKLHLKCDCSQGSIVNGTAEPILYSYALSSPTCHRIYKQPEIKLFKKINKSVLSHITFYLEDDDHKSFSFNGETSTFTMQMIKI